MSSTSQAPSKRQRAAALTFLLVIAGLGFAAMGLGVAAQASGGGFQPPTDPRAGQAVGASVFGGPNDLGTGKIGYMKDDLEQYPDSYAELDMGAALGGLPYMTPLLITGPSGSVVAYKRDIGRGGGPVPGGLPRSIDLWYELAIRIGFTDGLGTVIITPVNGVIPDPVAATAQLNALGNTQTRLVALRVRISGLNTRLRGARRDLQSLRVRLRTFRHNLRAANKELVGARERLAKLERRGEVLIRQYMDIAYYSAASPDVGGDEQALLAYVADSGNAEDALTTYATVKSLLRERQEQLLRARTAATVIREDRGVLAAAVQAKANLVIQEHRDVYEKQDFIQAVKTVRAMLHSDERRLLRQQTTFNHAYDRAFEWQGPAPQPRRAH